MRVAVLISGQVRTPRAWPSIREQLIEPYSADVYLATWDEGLVADFLAEIVCNYLVVPSTILGQLKRSILDTGAAMGHEEYFERGIPSGNSIVSPDNCIRQHYLNMVGSELISGEYDLIVKTRPDLSFSHVDLRMPEAATVYYPHNRRAVMNDQMFYGSPTAMRQMLRAYTYIPEYLSNNPDLAPLSNPEVFLKDWADHHDLRLAAVPLPVVTDRQAMPDEVNLKWPRRIKI